jgi:ribose 5-phosphate isomerase B
VEAEPDALGILICGTGIGVSITANRHPGIRAALCATELQARLAREHNNANVLCLGARITGDELARAITDAFLDGSFAGGRHQRRLDRINLPA